MFRFRSTCYGTFLFLIWIIFVLSMLTQTLSASDNPGLISDAVVYPGPQKSDERSKLDYVDQAVRVAAVSASADKRLKKLPKK